MKLFAKRYYVKGWRDEIYFLTAKQLYERVIEDSKSNYNWITSATELVSICRKKGFPEEYAKGIKIAILNCFASLKSRKEREESYELCTDEMAVYYCYNSLNSTEDVVVKAKQNYLRAFIKGITWDHFEIPIYSGKSYHKVCEEWIEATFRKYSLKNYFDFEFMRKCLDKEFGDVIGKAKEKGLFDADECKEMEIADKLFQKFLNTITDEMVN